MVFSGGQNCLHLTLQFVRDSFHLLVLVVLPPKKLSVLQSLAALLQFNDVNWKLGYPEHSELMPSSHTAY